MDSIKDFSRVIGNARHMALATSSGDNVPNVRIVDTLWQDGTLYFHTVAASPKAAEIKANNKVAFMTLPEGNGAWVRVREATAHISTKTMADVKDGFIANNPGTEKNLAALGIDAFAVFEIHFTEADFATETHEHGHVAL